MFYHRFSGQFSEPWTARQKSCSDVDLLNICILHEYNIYMYDIYNIHNIKYILFIMNIYMYDKYLYKTFSELKILKL